MARVVDVDVLKSLFRDRYDRAFMQMHSRAEREYWDGVCSGVNWGLNTIIDAPTADAVPVVRCKDCMYCIMDVASNELWCDHCKGLSSVLLDTDFCSYGERRTNGKA